MSDRVVCIFNMKTSMRYCNYFHPCFEKFLKFGLG